jgi:hypothetical protein
MDVSPNNTKGIDGYGNLICQPGLYSTDCSVKNSELMKNVDLKLRNWEYAQIN